MAGMQRTVLDMARMRSAATPEEVARQLHPAWQRLMNYCAQLGHGDIERLKIQDGLPMVAEVTTRKIKFSA